MNNSHPKINMNQRCILQLAKLEGQRHLSFLTPHIELLSGILAQKQEVTKTEFGTRK